jgi:hypothetical protein
MAYALSVIAGAREVDLELMVGNRTANRVKVNFR